jgi:hypothetical protein
MQQKSGDHWQPLGFFSRKLTHTESRFSTFDRELLAAHAAIKHFRHFCEGRAFQLRTDHKPLATAISCVLAPISPRQQRHLAFISEFNVQILYLPSLKNVVADFLSCPNQTTAGSVAATSAADPVDFEEMVAEQNRCPEMQRLLGGIPKIGFPPDRRSTPGWRCFHRQFSPNCSPQIQKNILKHFHNVAHPGRLASRHIISSRFVWHGLSSDVTAWARGCLADDSLILPRHLSLREIYQWDIVLWDLLLWGHTSIK